MDYSIHEVVNALSELGVLSGYVLSESDLSSFVVWENSEEPPSFEQIEDKIRSMRDSKQAIAEQTQANRESALAKLTALGLTVGEVQAILGE